MVQSMGFTPLPGQFWVEINSAIEWVAVIAGLLSGVVLQNHC